jgi:hypothetical protein
MWYGARACGETGGLPPFILWRRTSPQLGAPAARRLGHLRKVRELATIDFVRQMLSQLEALPELWQLATIHFVRKTFSQIVASAD